MLERSDVAPVWDRFVNHPFVLAMGDGTLPVESFKGYLVQDYLYLVSFFCVLREETALNSEWLANVEGLSRYTLLEPTPWQLTRRRTWRILQPFVMPPQSPCHYFGLCILLTSSQASGIVLHIERETSLHLTYCEGFGITREEMEKTEEKMACTAYTRYESIDVAFDTILLIPFASHCRAFSFGSPSAGRTPHADPFTPTKICPGRRTVRGFAGASSGSRALSAWLWCGSQDASRRQALDSKRKPVLDVDRKLRCRRLCTSREDWVR